MLILIAVYYYFGHVKLGKDEERPEFDDASYFMMIFCAGVAIGLIFYGAAEPMWHYRRQGVCSRKYFIPRSVARGLELDLRDSVPGVIEFQGFLSSRGF